MQRRTLISAGAALALLPGRAAWASDGFPNKPLRLLLGFSAGGGSDTLTRIMAEGLGRQLGQQVVVDNRPGADGVIAAQAVSSAPPDGYTLLMGTNTSMVAAPTLRPKPPYDPFKAFTPLSTAGQFSMFLVVPASLPVRSVKELLAWIDDGKAGPYNSASSNSASELAMLQLLGKRPVVNVRYKGDTQAITDMLGGQIQMMFTTGTMAAGFVKEGRVRALLTLLPRRSDLLPEVPTATELGLGSLTITPWAGFFGPPGMPPALTQRLSQALRDTLADPRVRAQLAEHAFDGQGSTPEAFEAFFRKQYQAFGDTIRTSGVKFD